MRDSRYSIKLEPGAFGLQRYVLRFDGQTIGQPHRFKRQAIAAMLEHNRVRIYAAAA